MGWQRIRHRRLPETAFAYHHPNLLPLGQIALLVSPWDEIGIRSPQSAGVDQRHPDIHPRPVTGVEQVRGLRPHQGVHRHRLGDGQAQSLGLAVQESSAPWPVGDCDPARRATGERQPGCLLAGNPKGRQRWPRPVALRGPARIASRISARKACCKSGSAITARSGPAVVARSSSPGCLWAARATVQRRTGSSLSCAGRAGPLVVRLLGTRRTVRAGLGAR